MQPAARNPITAAARSGILLVLAVAGLAGSARADVKLSAEAGGSYGLRVMSYRDMPFRTVVRQQYDFSCGSAALATLLRFHYGLAVNEQVVFSRMFAVGDQATIRKAGFSLLDMKSYLKSIGYTADGYRMPLDQLSRAGVPAVAVIDLGRYRHFVVIKGVGPDKVLVGDPALGLKVYPRKQFEKIWNGVVFVIHGDRAARSGAFNRAEEWQPRPKGALGSAMPDQSLAAFTLQLPTLFQIAPIRALN